MRKKRISHLIMAVLMIISMFQILAVDRVDSHAAGYSLSGSAHIQTYADTAGKWDGKTLTLGTTGQAKRLESITINFTNNTGYDGSIEYRVHRQTYGWTGWVENGKPAGTTGQAKRLEAIQIRLTGELAEHYDVRYRVHAQTYGWAQGWQYNGALAGTTGEAKRLEALEVQILEKDADSVAAVSYRVHRQTYGWEKVWAKDGVVSGTTGQAKRLEGITIAVSNSPYNGSIEYRTHVQSYGWMPWVANGEMSGTQGEYKRLEAIQIRLTGEMAEHYDVYYRVHAQSYGWLGWAKNGAEAGTSGYGKRLEAIQIVLVKKGEATPTNVGGIQSADQSPYHDMKVESGAGDKPGTETPTEHTHTWIPVTEKETKHSLFIDNEYIMAETVYADGSHTYLYNNEYEPYSKIPDSELTLEQLLNRPQIVTTDGSYQGISGLLAFYDKVKAGMTEYEEPNYVYGITCGGCGAFFKTVDELMKHKDTSIIPECDIYGYKSATELDSNQPYIHHTVRIDTETQDIITGYKCNCGETKSN